MILIGLVLVLALVFGGYMLSGGSMDIMLHALPFEGMMVGGASIGAWVIANNFAALKQTLRGILRAFKGARWKKADYVDLLKLLFELGKANKVGPQELEKHIENPETSSIFAKYPKIAKDHEASTLIADAFRLLLMGFDDPMKTEEVMNAKIETHEKFIDKPVHNLTMIADGLPAIGIVAAVLGVIKTMSAVDEPPEILGAMIGGALVGTFLGVFLAYCLVAPIAQRLAQINGEDAHFGEVIRDVIVATVEGHNPAICVEIGRGRIPPDLCPDFKTVEQELKGAT